MSSAPTLPRGWAPWTPPRHTGEPRVVELTPMLGNVLQSLAEGRDPRGVAADWGISENTAKTHLRLLYGRCGARGAGHLLSMLLTGELRVTVPDRGWSIVGGTLRLADPYPPRS